MNARALSIARSVAVIGGTGALILGATYAATTTNNVTVAADVTVSNNLTISDTSGGTYGNALTTGYSFNIHPGVATATHKHVFLKTTEPTGAVKLSVQVPAASLGTNADANKSHITVHFKTAAGQVDKTLADLKDTDVSLATLGGLVSPGSNDVELWATADASTPEIGTNNGFTVQFTGTDDGTVTP